MPHTNKEMSWFCIQLTPEQREFGFDNIIRAEMEEIWISQGAREGISLWLEEGEDKRSIYFSPLAASIAQILIFRFNGSPCNQPDLAKLTFLLGHAFRDDTI